MNDTLHAQHKSICPNHPIFPIHYIINNERTKEFNSVLNEKIRKATQIDNYNLNSMLSR